MIHCAKGTKYAPPAEVPGTSTSTFLACEAPIFRTPTLSYFAGVPAEVAPAIQMHAQSAAWAVPLWRQSRRPAREEQR